jgi:hypothetical protein
MPELLTTGSNYARRRDALFQRIETFVSFANSQAGSIGNPTQVYALRQLALAAEKLRLFANAHLGYFNNEAAHQPPEGYAAEYAIALAIHQIGFDLEVLEQAVYQRLFSAPEAINTLNIADQMARTIIQEAKKLPSINDPSPLAIPSDSTAITYFQKSPRFHGMPYAPIALTSIPYTATQARRDLLATPHELGHYIYWRMNRGEQVEKDVKIESQNGWTGRWLEEIFADVFCYLVGGLITGLSLQDLLLRHAHFTFTIVDSSDTHPAPILRPFIHQVVLQLLNQTAEAHAIVNRWQTQLTEKLSGQPGQVILPYTYSRLIKSLITMNGTPTEKPIDQIIQALFQQLAPLQPIVQWAGSTNANSFSDELAIAHQLDVEFAQRVILVEETSLTDIGPDADPWRTWLAQEGFSEEGSEHWLDIAHARGWVERPPDNWPKTG